MSQRLQKEVEGNRDGANNADTNKNKEVGYRLSASVTTKPRAKKYKRKEHESANNNNWKNHCMSID